MFSLVSFAASPMLFMPFSSAFQSSLNSRRLGPSLRLLVSRANEIAFTPSGFLDHRGNRLLFGLRVYDDEGRAERVRQLYVAMISDRLVDILLGPQSQPAVGGGPGRWPGTWRGGVKGRKVL